MMKVSNQMKGCIYGCIAAISYGVNPLCAKLLYKDGINCNSVLCYRFMIGTLLLALFMLLGRRSFSLTRKETYVLTLLGGVFAISSLTYFLSFHYMSAGVAATLVFAYPVFVAVLMAIFFKERLKWPSISAIALTIIGILLLYKDDSGRPIAHPRHCAYTAFGFGLCALYYHHQQEWHSNVERKTNILCNGSLLGLHCGLCLTHTNRRIATIARNRTMDLRHNLGISANSHILSVYGHGYKVHWFYFNSRDGSFRASNLYCVRHVTIRREYNAAHQCRHSVYIDSRNVYHT